MQEIARIVFVNRYLQSPPSYAHASLFSASLQYEFPMWSKSAIHEPFLNLHYQGPNFTLLQNCTRDDCAVHFCVYMASTHIVIAGTECRLGQAAIPTIIGDNSIL